MIRKYVFLFLIFSGFVFACTSKHGQKEENSTKGKSEYYAEKFRPQFHFSPEANWMNDPNGMFYFEGEYHLFYQYYPDSTVWGPMHWGHAVSQDMVSWEHLPIALYPDEHGYIFSGSAVVDWNNTSGLGTDGKSPLVAIFTYHEPKGAAAGEIDYQTQGIAYSNDKGRTWTKYGEPVLKNPGIIDFRDPKVSWHNDIQKWVMALAVKDHIEFYSSENLIDWKKESEFGKESGAHGGVWECPDLFQLNVEGTEEKQWILFVSINPGGPNDGSATQYFVGDFDGSKFTTKQTNTKWIDYGRDNYAGVTWSDIPEADGRRLFLGWMSNWNYANVVPTEKWRSAMTIPRELILIKENNEFKLTSVPVDELKKLRDASVTLPAQKIPGNVELASGEIPLNRCEMLFNFNLGVNSESVPAEEFGVVLSNEKGEMYKIVCSPKTTTFYTDRTKGGVDSFSDNFASISKADFVAGSDVKLHVFVDEASVELFVNGGKLVLTDIVFPSEPYTKLEVFSTKGEVELSSAELWSLKSIW